MPLVRPADKETAATERVVCDSSQVGTCHAKRQGKEAELVRQRKIKGNCGKVFIVFFVEKNR